MCQARASLQELPFHGPLRGPLSPGFRCYRIPHLLFVLASLLHERCQYHLQRLSSHELHQLLCYQDPGGHIYMQDRHNLGADAQMFAILRA